MHKRLRGIDGRATVKVLRYFGFSYDRQKGSHEQWTRRTPVGKLRVTVDSKARSYAPPTLKSMIQQSGHSEEDWVKALDEI